MVNVVNLYTDTRYACNWLGVERKINSGARPTQLGQPLWKLYNKATTIEQSCWNCHRLSAEMLQGFLATILVVGVFIGKGCSPSYLQNSYHDSIYDCACRLRYAHYIFGTCGVDTHSLDSPLA